MTTKRKSARPRARARRRLPACHHRLEYETDWLGRTYVGCPLCNRWRPVKARPEESHSKRLAA